MVQIKNSGMMKTVSSMVYDLPSPSSLSIFWNWGSIMGLVLGSQLATGLFLSLHYVSSIEAAFFSVDMISRESLAGWLMRMVHANGASAFFVAAYLHTGRGIYFQSYRLSQTWALGVTLLLVLMAAAFLGYVLPWGQMSFWGATVITNLISAIPVIGQQIVEWVWGGFSVSQATLTRFFSFHFLAPFILSVLVMSHLMALHSTGSSNPLGLPMSSDKVLFSPYYIWKDLAGFVAVSAALLVLVSVGPWVLGDPENFIPANPLVTPIHIQPEWYFLFAYAILRSVPSKLGGVTLLMLSILVLLMGIVVPKSNLRASSWYPAAGLSFWALVATLLILTWIGARPIEEPFYFIGQVGAAVYFVLLGLVFLGPMLADSALKCR